MSKPLLYPSILASLTLATLTAAAMSLGACNSYDPNLGNAPFRCGTDSPRCPDNYTCVTYSAAEEICEANSGFDDRADAGEAGGADAQNLTCNNDSEIEPNNSLDKATNAIFPASGSFRLVSLAICPTGDEDYFEFYIPDSGTNVVVEVEYMSARGPLSLELLKGDGSVLSSGTPAAGNNDILRVAIPNIAQDTYFARVSPGEAGAQNNYNFQITLN